MGPSGKCILEFRRTFRWLPFNAERPENAHGIHDVPIQIPPGFVGPFAVIRPANDRGSPAAVVSGFSLRPA